MTTDLGDLRSEGKKLHIGPVELYPNLARGIEQQLQLIEQCNQLMEGELGQECLELVKTVRYAGGFGYLQDMDRMFGLSLDGAKLLHTLAGYQEDQYVRLRSITGLRVRLHAKMQDSPLVGVYWGGGTDRFAYGFEGNWIYLGVETEGSDDLGVRLSGRPRHVSWNVLTPGLPPGIAVNSVDVAVFKTLGTAPPEIENAFWKRIMETTKPGGLLVASEEIPASLKRQLIPDPVMQQLNGGNHEIVSIPESVPIASTMTTDGGYDPRMLSFWVKK